MIEIKKLKEVILENDLAFVENQSHIIIHECPNCGGKDKIFLDKKSLLWQCFKCRGLSQTDTARGNGYTFLTKVVGLDPYSSMKLIKEGDVASFVPETISISTQEEIKEEEKIIETYSMPSFYVKLDGSLEQLIKHKEVYKYLISRHVTDKNIISKFQLRYDPLAKRLVFPSYDVNMNCIGVQTRDITDRYKKEHLKCPNFECSLFRKFYFDDESKDHCPECGTKLEFSYYPKASNSRNFPKEFIFYNERNIDWSKPVVLVEGPFDCINTNNAIGLLGRTLSHYQLEKLKSKTNLSLILFLDGDKAGTESTIEVFKQLEAFIFNIKIAYLDSQEDPGARSIKDNDIIIANATIPLEWSMKKSVLI